MNSYLYVKKIHTQTVIVENCVNHYFPKKKFLQTIIIEQTWYQFEKIIVNS
jgi:hypothetical protein